MTDSVYKQVLYEIERVIRGLGLEGLAQHEIQVRKTPWTDRTIYDGITISPSPEIEYRPEMSTNVRDTVGYPCVITMIDGTGKGVDEHIGRITKWRQCIRREFNCKRLSRVYDSGTHGIICRVKHEDVHVPKQYEDNYDIHRMVVVCWFLEPRSCC